MIKAALFDLDGVVFDTESQYSIFWGMIGREYHPEMPDFEYRIKGQTLVQIYDKYFTDEEINRLSVVAPNIGLSIIKDYEIVEKKTVETPDTLKGIVKCNNPKCITNNEPMQTLFHTVDKVLGIVRCHYCDKEQQLGKVELCK